MKTTTVLRHFGGPAATAKALGIEKGSVSSWGDTVPPLRQCQIEDLTGGKIKKDANVYRIPTRRAKA